MYLRARRSPSQLMQALGREREETGDALEERVRARAVLETDAVADLLAERDVHLVGDTLGDAHGGDSSRLCARDLEAGPPQVRQVGVGDVLRDPAGVRRARSGRSSHARRRRGGGDALGRLAGAGLAGKDDELVGVEHLEELVHLLVDGELLADREDVGVALREGLQRERVDVAGL